MRFALLRGQSTKVWVRPLARVTRSRFPHFGKRFLLNLCEAQRTEQARRLRSAQASAICTLYPRGCARDARELGARACDGWISVEVSSASAVPPLICVGTCVCLRVELAAAHARPQPRSCHPHRFRATRPTRPHRTCACLPSGGWRLRAGPNARPHRRPHRAHGRPPHPTEDAALAFAGSETSGRIAEEPLPQPPLPPPPLPAGAAGPMRVAGTPQRCHPGARKRHLHTAKWPVPSGSGCAGREQNGCFD